MKTWGAIFLVLWASTAMAQTTPKLPPASPKEVVKPLFWGDVSVPITKAERQSGKIVFKRIVKRLPPNRLISRSLTVWVFDYTHPLSDGTNRHLKEGEAYDPRNVRVTTRYIAFDAVAGDHIFWRVGGNQQ
jgi:hypothetical protein